MELRQVLEGLVVTRPWKEWAKDAKYAAGAAACKKSINDDDLFKTLELLQGLGQYAALIHMSNVLSADV